MKHLTRQMITAGAVLCLSATWTAANPVHDAIETNDVKAIQRMLEGAKTLADELYHAPYGGAS